MKKDQIFGSKYKYFNSYFDTTYTFMLRFDNFFDEYSFDEVDTITKKLNEHYTEFLYPITPKTQFIYITFQTYLVITKRIGELELFLIHINSRIKLPVENYIKNFKKWF